MSTPDHPAKNLAREDVHKSCRSLETVVNLLNGYCEAASAMVVLQKQLAKAIRDSASMKVSPAVANNTLNIAAAILEIISEVDGKFVKIADKECDSVTDDVKKWFRKLAREERTHDDKIASASARIKQAGMTYEKKVKKNARDAAEEHTRYIQLLSSIGHEMSQEKTNHSNFVAQKHYAVTCSVSSSLARIADAEWARCCESIRKSSPQIGSLGEWRSFCDVGWMGKIPDDLPDAETPAATGPSLAALPAVEEELVSDTDLGVNKTSPTNISRDYTPSDVPPAPPPPMVDPGPSQHDSGTVKRDIPALDHFPAPPVHFPLPHLRGALKSPLDGPFENPPSYGRRMTSPVSPTQESSSPTPMTPTQPVVAAARQTLSPATNLTAEQPIHLPTSSRSDPVSPRSDPHQLIPSADLQTAVLTSDNSEFGIRQSHPPPGLPGPTSLPKGSPRNSGVVLAMRNRFSQNPVSSTPPRETATPILRQPVSVSTTASRYQPSSEHPPVRSDRFPTGTTSESSSNDTNGTNVLSTSVKFERTRREPPPEGQNLEQRLRAVELEPQQRRVIRSTSAQAVNSSTRDHWGEHNQPASTWETIGPNQNVTTHRIPPVEAERIQRGLTRSPSPVSPHATPDIGPPDSPQENPPMTKPRGWIRRLSMPVFSSLDGSKKSDSPTHSDSSQAWRSNLALPETRTRHRKASFDTLGGKSNQKR